MESVQELQRLLPDQEVPDFLSEHIEPSAGDEASVGYVTSNAAESNRGQRSAPRERNIVPPSDIARFARETLLAEGKPMKRGQLVRAILKRGLPLAGRDPSKNLGTILWRHRDQFINLEHLGYWPRDIALPGAYDPSKPPEER
ncbi:hypothetical protein [Aureimonas psammosilenae]|uniref:hypothetical protein n=1 Tax=Aureimonas psammosilenae TaxID=2495496 RepID=UPI0012612872|nr:hypothetical protein [Aureimonas psammosilenae]